MKYTDHYAKEIASSLEAATEKLSDKYEVSPNVLEDIFISEALPVDDNKWPRHWISPKRLESLFDKLDSELYWLGFTSGYPSNVAKVAEQWNTYAEMPLEKLRRIFENEKPFKVKKVYIRSRHLKDLYVVLYLLKSKHCSVKSMIKTTVRRLKDINKGMLTPRVVWKWCQYGEIESEEAKDSGVGMLEVGDDQGNV